jgi:Na+-translocating ferredoxin:NAD+ oxidoreductase RnfG subunit
MKRVHFVIVVILAALAGCIVTLVFTGTFKKIMVETMSQMMMKMCDKMKCDGKSPIDMCKKMMGN